MPLLHPTSFLLRMVVAFASIFLFGLTSCSPSFYAPSPHHVPLLDEAGELNTSVSGTLYPRSISTNVQAAYSPTENLGVMVNTSLFEMPEHDSSGSRGFEGALVEAAVGYYTKVSDNWAFEAYGGYGYLFHGNSAGFSPDDYSVDFNYHRLFIQPSLGRQNDIIDFYFSCRFSHLQFRNIRHSAAVPPQGFFDHPVLERDENFLMIEPSFGFRLGYRYVKFQWQLGTAVNFSPADFEYDRVAVSFGLVFNIPTQDFLWSAKSPAY